MKSHERLLVILDAQWDGSPGGRTIEGQLARRIERNGWPRDRFEVVAIDPELEAWLWSDQRALGVAMSDEVPAGRREELLRATAGLEAEGGREPKERLAKMRASFQIAASSAQFRRFAATARVDRCADPAFGRLRDALRRWFPP